MKWLLGCILAVLLAAPAFGATLTWVDNSSNETGFEVWREVGACTSPDAFVKIGEVAVNVKTFLDATTLGGNQYCYEVRAFNNSMLDGSGVLQFSGYSNKAGITYPLAVPSQPSGLGVAP